LLKSLVRVVARPSPYFTLTVSPSYVGHCHRHRRTYKFAQVHNAFLNCSCDGLTSDSLFSRADLDKILTHPHLTRAGCVIVVKRQLASPYFKFAGEGRTFFIP
jgi:hypothetical protein